MKKQKGITLIATIVTIVVLLLLTGLGIKLLTGEDGLIARIRLSIFMSEMKGIKDNVKAKELTLISNNYLYGDEVELFDTKLNVNNVDILDTLKREILYGKAGMPDDSEPSDYDVDDFENLLDEEGNVSGIYIIDKETGDGKENTYIYDEETETVYKIPATKIGGKVYHSYDTAVRGKGGESSEGDGYIEEEPNVEHVGNIYYYGPDLRGFNGKTTYLIYYSSDFTKTKEVSAEEYIAGGQQRQIEDKGETYTLHDYEQKIWANIKTKANSQEAWWVWIPRYAYKLDGTDTSNPKVDITYVGENDLPLDPNNQVLPEGQSTHPSFNVGNKKLRGIWISKYEPNYGDFSGNNKVLAPDMSGFDKENTYIELYDKETNTFEEVKLSEANLNSINNDNRWYDYKNKIWANIKTISGGQEAWWVWIPRFAYNIMENSTVSPIIEPIFVDTSDKPLDSGLGTKLPNIFSVHPAFNTKDGEKLRGIWMSKYEPSFGNIYNEGNSDYILEPNINKFDTSIVDGKANTYVVYYSKDFTQTKEVPLAEYISNGKKRQIEENGETYTFYDYQNKMWANIKTVANNQEAWWVWIPRYAYSIMENSTVSPIIEPIFINTEDKPLNPAIGTKLPSTYTVHPAFNTKDGEKLEGIWMSKYEPSDSEAQ